MVRRAPAPASTAGQGTTTSQSRGGLFVDVDEVGVNLAGVTGERGPQGLVGPQGVGVADISGTRLSTFALRTHHARGSISYSITCLLYTSPSPRDS